MPKADVIADLRAARAQLRTAIEALTPDQMVQPGVVDLWSIKDVLANIVAWEAELITALARLEQHKHTPPHIIEIEDIDAWNDEQYHVNVRRALDDVLQDFEGVHRHLILAIEDLSNRVLEDNREFEWMEGEPLSYLIADVAIWPEEEYAETIRAWRESASI